MVIHPRVLPVDPNGPHATPSSYRKVRCPRCRRVNDGHVAAGQHPYAPADGDISVCWNCHGVNIFGTTLDGDIALREPTATEWAALRDHPDIRYALAAVVESDTILEAAALYRHMSLMGGPDAA